MVGFTLLSRSYYYLHRRSPGPPFPPDHRQAGGGRGAIKQQIFARGAKTFLWSEDLFVRRHLCGRGPGRSDRFSRFRPSPGASTTVKSLDVEAKHVFKVFTAPSPPDTHSHDYLMTPFYLSPALTRSHTWQR